MMNFWRWLYVMMLLLGLGFISSYVVVIEQAKFPRIIMLSSVHFYKHKDMLPFSELKFEFQYRDDETLLIETAESGNAHACNNWYGFCASTLSIESQAHPAADAAEHRRIPVLRIDTGITGDFDKMVLTTSYLTTHYSAGESLSYMTGILITIFQNSEMEKASSFLYKFQIVEKQWRYQFDLKSVKQFELLQKNQATCRGNRGCRICRPPFR